MLFSTGVPIAISVEGRDFLFSHLQDARRILCEVRTDLLRGLGEGPQTFVVADVRVVRILLWHVPLPIEE